jgi:hypothetical protein
MERWSAAPPWVDRVKTLEARDEIIKHEAVEERLRAKADGEDDLAEFDYSQMSKDELSNFVELWRKVAVVPRRRRMPTRLRTCCILRWRVSPV